MGFLGLRVYGLGLRACVGLEGVRLLDQVFWDATTAKEEPVYGRDPIFTRVTSVFPVVTLQVEDGSPASVATRVTSVFPVVTLQVEDGSPASVAPKRSNFRSSLLG